MLLLFLSLMLVIPNTSFATTHETHINELASSTKMIKEGIAYIGPHKGNFNYWKSAQKGTYSSIIWSTKENKTWEVLDSALLKELKGLSSAPTLNKYVVWKTFKITKFTDESEVNGKKVVLKGYGLQRMPSAVAVTPQYILSNTSKLDYMEDTHSRGALYASEEVDYMGYGVYIDLLQEKDDFRVVYNFNRNLNSQDVLADLWKRLNLQGEASLDTIVNCNQLKYMIYDTDDGLILTVGKSTSKTFDQKVIKELDLNNHSFDYSSNNSLLQGFDEPLRNHTTVAFEGFNFEVTDILGIDKEKPAQTIVKLPADLDGKSLWQILRLKYDFKETEYPTKYLQIGDLEIKFDDQIMYLRKNLYSIFINPWYLVIGGLDIEYQPQQMVQKGNKLVVENINLSGYNCRVEMMDDGRGKNENIVYYYVDTTDSLPKVWEAFMDYFEYKKSEMVGVPTSKNFKLEITGIDGTHVYTQLFKQTKNQVIIKSSR